MVLFIKNKEMENPVPMSEAVEVVEKAFREAGEGKAVNSPRTRLRSRASARSWSAEPRWNVKY